MYRAKNTVRMHDTDMAGVIFFANQFRYVHEALEDFAASEGFSFRQVFEHENYLFVIRHAAADYLKPLAVGDPLDIELSIRDIGESSFVVHYDILRAGELVGTAETVHVTLDKKSRKKIPIPALLLSKLQKHLYHVSAPQENQ